MATNITIIRFATMRKTSQASIILPLNKFCQFTQLNTELTPDGIYTYSFDINFPLQWFTDNNMRMDYISRRNWTRQLTNDLNYTFTLISS